MVLNLGSLGGGAATGATVSIVIQALDKFSKPMNDAKKGLDDVGKSTGKLTKFFNANQVAISAAAGAVVGFSIDAVKSAIKAEGAFQSFNLVMGETADIMLKDLRLASKGMISDFQLVQNANYALALGIQKNDIPGLLEVATARAKIFGRTATEAFNDLSVGIGRNSKLILDNLGVIIPDMTKLYDEFAVSIGKTGDELTDSEKKQALVNKIIEDSAGLVKAQNFLLETHAEKIERVSASWQNAKREIGEYLLEMFDFMSGTKLVEEAFKAQVEAVTGGAVSYDEVASSIVNLNSIQNELTTQLTQSNNAAQDLINSLLNLSDIAFAGEREKNLEIAQQKEIIRQLELRELRGEDVGDILDAEQKKLQEMRLEAQQYDNEREIQAAKNAIELEKMGELETTTFEKFAAYSQQKIQDLEDERQKQETLRQKIQEVNDVRDDIIKIYEDAGLASDMFYSNEISNMDEVIEKAKELGRTIVDNASGYKTTAQREDETPVDYANRVITETNDAELKKAATAKAAYDLTIGQYGLLTPGGIVNTLVTGVKNLLGFQEGGIVPGPIGKPNLAVVHGGETVIPANKSGGLTIVIEGNSFYGVDAQDIADNLYEQLKPMINV